MSNTNRAQDLCQRIEQLIQEHLAASRVFAQEAVARGFGAATGSASRLARPVKASPGKKRPSEDIAALGERFYKVVRAKPGETMAVLAADVGASARELHRSVTLLRRANRIRAVGSRHLTRYFRNPSTSGVS